VRIHSVKYGCYIISESNVVFEFLFSPCKMILLKKYRGVIFLAEQYYEPNLNHGNEFLCFDRVINSNVVFEALYDMFLAT
jgi:hypothetical protein